MEPTRVVVCELIYDEARRALELEGLREVEVVAYRVDLQDPIRSAEHLDTTLQELVGFEGAVCIFATSSEVKALPRMPRPYAVIQTQSCIEMLAGEGMALDLLTKGAYSLVPGALRRSGKGAIGDHDVNIEIMIPADAREIVLLDTGLGDWSMEGLQALATSSGKPFSVLPVGLDPLRLRMFGGVVEARLRLELEKAREEGMDQARMRSDYAMAFDLLERISQGTEEETITGSIVDVLYMLFSPADVEYYALRSSGEFQLFDYEKGAFARIFGGSTRSLMNDVNVWDEASSGFRIKVENKGKVLGVAVLRDLSFPEFWREYLNLASQLSVVFGLAVANARAFKDLRSSEAQVERALSLESTMLEISQGFFGRPDFEWEVGEALARVGGAVGCSRVLLLQQAKEMTSLACTHEWAAAGIPSVMASLASVPMSLHDWLMEGARYEGTVRALSTSSIGEEDRVRLSPLLQGGVISMLIASVLIEGRQHGLVILQRTEERSWEEDETSMLRFLVQNLSVAMQRRNAQEDMAKLAESVTMSNKVLRHDIRNELMVLSGSLQLYEMKKEQKQLERANRSAARLTDILDHFKELDSFLQSSRALFPVDLRMTILQVMATHQMDYDIQGDAKVLADFALSSVIDNLVRNAKRHGDATTINFIIKREGGTVQLIVADDGKGIPEAARPKLFQEGFSYGEKRSTGLGLFWIRKTMERYGGWVKLVDSERGAAFSLGFSSA
jgi:signal transduction histidine kinase